MPEKNRTVVFCDSSIRELCIRFIDEDPIVIGYPEIVTNNTGEYRAVTFAIEQLIERGYKEATVYTDSQLVVYQVQGHDANGREWKRCKAHLQPLRDHIRELLDKNKGYVLQWIPREYNQAGKVLEKPK